MQDQRIGQGVPVKYTVVTVFSLGEINQGSGCDTCKYIKCESVLSVTNLSKLLFFYFHIEILHHSNSGPCPISLQEL